MDLVLKIITKMNSTKGNKRISGLCFISIILILISVLGVNALTIGGRENGYYNGTIDEIRIWDRVLSPLEARQHYYSNLFKYGMGIWGFYNKQVNLTFGTYTYQGYAMDILGDANQTEVRYLVIANTPPTIPEVTYPIDGMGYTDIPYINFSSIDADGDLITYFVYINGILNITTTTNVTDWNASDGQYSLTVSASDGIEFSDNSTPILFTLSSTMPIVRIIYPTNGSNIQSNSIDLNASAVDDSPILTYYWVINGTLNSTTVNSNSSLDASDGYYNLTLFVSDGMQNGSDTVYFRLNTRVPSFSNNKTNASNTTYNGTDVQINITITDRVGVDYYRLATNDTADGSWANESLINANENVVNATFNHSIKNFPLNGGMFGWKVWANNSIGDINVSNIYTFPVADSLPPIIIEKSPSGIVPVSRISLNVTTNEEARCRYVPNTEGNLSTTYEDMPYNFAGISLYHNQTMILADGYYEFYARCIDNSGNVMNKSENISFTVYVEIITIYIAGGGGGGGVSVERKVEERILLEFDAPPSKTIFSGDVVKVPIKLRNKGDLIVNNTRLDTETNAPNLTLDLSEDFFDKLEINEEKEFTLNIKSLTKPTAHIGISKYFISIMADVPELRYKTSVYFFIEAKERDYEARLATLKQMEFVQDLFEKHPECLRFSNQIEQARYHYENSEYKKALSLIDSAIQSCRDLIASEEVVEKPTTKKKVDMVILTIELITLFVLMLGMFYYYKRRIVPNLELRFSEILNKTKKSMIDGDIFKAREGYIDLYSLYKGIVSSNLPYNVKLDCYRRIHDLYSELSKIMRNKKIDNFKLI